jgi:DUF2924 family protein
VLERIAEQAAQGSTAGVVLVREATPGTVLIREWRGASHLVTVLYDGVLYRQQRYRSLSEVARLITGTRWSGPLFFGLRSRAKEAADGTR